MVLKNKDKYLKDGVDVYEIANGINEAYLDSYDEEDLVDCVARWFNTTATPTLTEDEKVILRNTKGYTTIIRNIEYNIQIENEDGSFACLCAFNHLFQFIKPRRRI